MTPASAWPAPVCSRVVTRKRGEPSRSFSIRLPTILGQGRRRYRLGELSYILGDLPEARKWLESFLADAAKHPNQETAWTYLGDVRFGLDDLPAARTAYERSLADFPRGQLADRSRYGLGRTLAGLNADGCRPQGVQ